jgi:2-keto-4-pentenoate hydratase/2-oxohepta-3-ene-1,7-dioic acid hydratase in catechol pathway
MAKWVRFNSNGQTCLGMLDGDNISLCSNDLYAEPAPTGENVALSDVELLTPFTPNSILALWNNFYERAEAEGQTIPTNPLYFMKPVTSVIGP